MPDKNINTLVDGEGTLPPAKEYLESPKPSVRLACGNCGSKKIFKRTDLDLELEIAECEQCSRLFAVCPICHLPSGLEAQEMEEFQRFWKCPNCDINFTLNTQNANEYIDMWAKEPAANNYPYGNPEVTYDTKGGVPMEDLDATLKLAPVGHLTPGNEPSIQTASEEEAKPVRRTRKAKTTEVEE